ncbi:MAG TPA: SDR family oxidoreductase [Gammaproteobacteria bacterium]|nr:SDR family oxidoreductase [Gammaproteobacteria bacterium]
MPIPRNETRWAEMGVSLEGSTALVTGATDGLGKEVARQLAALGALVIVHGRDEARGAAAVQAIQAGGKGGAVFRRADFGSLAEVRALADWVGEHHGGIDLLINNAAATVGERRESADGFELAFAVNHLAPFVLTQRLLPKLEANAPARIVNVSSMGQTPVDFDDLMMEKRYDAFDAYRRSKLAQIMFTIDLAARLDPAKVTVSALHPARAMNTPRVLNGGFTPLSTVEEGAESVLQAAVSPEVKGRTGVYFNQLVEARANEQAYDAAARAKLWAISLELTGRS